MVTLVIVKNPFSPQDGREIKVIEAHGTLTELIEAYKMPGVDLQASVNGYTCEETEIKDGDFIVIYPVVEKGGGKGGKGILGIVAAIALSVVSFGIASGGWLASSGFFAAGHLGAYMAAAAVMFLGSSLMGRFMGQKTDLGAFDANNEPTYSWGGVQTMEGQNNAISLTYGKVKSGGQTIGKFVSTQNDEEYLNWLVACGEGELTITDIKLNDNPVANYDAVTCEIRSGTNVQEVIPYFNDTYFTKNLSYHMTEVNTWYTDTAQGTATDGLVFKIELPNGLYHGNDSGGFDNSYVDVQVQYKLTSASTWTTLTTERITGNSNKSIRREIRVDNITSGAYNVRARVTAFQHTNATRDMHEIYWTGITSIVYDDFVYPCQALIGIRAKATDQLSGNPALTFMKERGSVWVYNPYSKTYEEQAADNPAWACYDFIHQARKLENTHTKAMEIEVRGAAKELLRYDDFAEWAAWCVEKNYKVNIEINTSGEVLEMVNQKIAPIGHGLVVRFGTKFGCIYDHVQTPVQMFGMGNIKQGTFNEEFLKISDRANCVEITFTNKDAGYERDVLTIYGDTYDTDGYVKTAQMTLDGIVDYRQAYREGKYQLYTNRYLLRTVSFEAGIDAIACTVGDVVLVSHDVPKWANSGRIHSVSNKQFVLPVELEDLTQSYRIQWRTEKDNLYARACTVVSSADGWTTVNVSGTIPTNDKPKAGDVFDLAAASTGSKPFVVKGITRAQDFTRRITCLEYNENIFNENYDVPVINYSTWRGEPKNVTGLVAGITQSRNSFGEKVGKLRCSWNVPDNGGTYTVLLSTDGVTWKIGKSGVKENSCELDVLPDTTYFVKVITVLGVNQSTGSQVGPIYPTGEGALPNVTNLTGYTRYRGVKNGEERYEIHLLWTPPLLSNYQSCDIWYKTNHAQVTDLLMTQGVAVNELGFENDWKYAGSGYTDFTMPDVITGDTYRFAVVTKDSLGNTNRAGFSPYVDVVATAKTETPNTPDGFSLKFLKDGCMASWKDVSNADIQYYEIRTNTSVGVEDDNLLARTSGTSTAVPVTSRTGTLYLYARSVLGKYSAPAKLEYVKATPPKPGSPQLTGKLGGFSISTSSIPTGCTGMRIYISGVEEEEYFTQNTVYNYPCGAGIYDVQIAYTDYFGVGEKSNTNRIVVKALVDETLLEEQAITKEKLETAIQTAVDDAIQSVKEIARIDDSLQEIDLDVSGIVTELNKEPGESGYHSIAKLKTEADGIVGTVAEYQATQEGVNEAVASQLVQNANAISAVVTNLETAAGARKYAALQIMQDGIASKVALGDVTSYFQQDHTGFYIKGSLIKIDGDTVIGNNIITQNMIQSNAINASKIASDAITSDKIAAGAVTAEKMTIGSSSGARLELTKNLLRVYDSSGKLRVRLGVWT